MSRADRMIDRQPNWRVAQGRADFDAIRVGSVIRWNGRLRTVRVVDRYPDGRIYTVGFAKLRKSGYRGPLTYYHRTDIRASFGGIVAHRKGALCATDLECRLTAAIEAGTAEGINAVVSEAETVGVIW